MSIAFSGGAARQRDIGIGAGEENRIEDLEVSMLNLPLQMKEVMRELHS